MLLQVRYRRYTRQDWNVVAEQAVPPVWGTFLPSPIATFPVTVRHSQIAKMVNDAAFRVDP